MRQVILGACAISLLFVASPCAAEEQAMEDVNFSYGLVVKASADELVLAEYDLDRDQEVEISYAIDPSTSLENFTTLDELKTDDEIEIEFKTSDGLKKATKISKVVETEEDVTNGPEDMEDGSEPSASDNLPYKATVPAPTK